VKSSQDDINIKKPKNINSPAAKQLQTTPPTEQSSKTKGYSRKWIVGIVAASLLLVGGGVATYTLSKTEYYKEEVQPKFIGYQIQLKSKQKTFKLDLGSIGYHGDYSSLDKKKLAAWLDGIRKELDQPAVNAKLKDKKAGTDIIPEKPGQLVDTKQVVEWFKEGNIKKLYNRPRQIPMIEDKPTLTAADLNNLDKVKIGKFTTNMGATAGNRVENIRLASNTIDGFVLKPGEVFSWNGYVGDTTADKGYKPAGVIVNGKMATGYGGGICQVSTTLFNAVEKAGLKIVSRTAHSKPVGYVPLGRDATIAYPYTDFKFANNLNKPVVIKADASSYLSTVAVYTMPGAKKLTKEELKELKYPKPKTDSFTKLLLGYDPEEEKRIKELQKSDDKPEVKITDDMLDQPVETKPGPNQNEDENEANSL
jgi:vancomycin resistance protein YoaR